MHGTGESPRDATLLDVLIDAFEKNEILRGWHWRSLPMPDDASAREKFAAYAEEAARWKGTPSRLEDEGPRRIAAWPDLQIRQVGRGLMILARAPRFTWWHEAATWAGDPMGPLHDWLDEEDGPGA